MQGVTIKMHVKPSQVSHSYCTYYVRRQFADLKIQTRNWWYSTIVYPRSSSCQNSLEVHGKNHFMKCVQSPQRLVHQRKIPLQGNRVPGLELLARASGFPFLPQAARALRSVTLSIWRWLQSNNRNWLLPEENEGIGKIKKTKQKNHGPENAYYLHTGFARYRSEWAWGGW